MRMMQRRRELLAWLNAERFLSLSEIVERFSISKMTAHRDLQELEERQLIKRIHGGVAAIESHEQMCPPAPAASPSQRFRCTVCQRPVNDNLLYSVTLASGEQRQACCPHCGIMAHLSLGDSIVMAMTADYLLGLPHPAYSSYFVMGSVVLPCCSPSILTFEKEEMANRFVKGFGGSIGRLPEAIAFLEQEMSLSSGKSSCPKCSQRLVMLKN